MNETKTSEKECINKGIWISRIKAKELKTPIVFRVISSNNYGRELLIVRTDVYPFLWVYVMVSFRLDQTLFLLQRSFKEFLKIWQGEIFERR